MTQEKFRQEIDTLQKFFSFYCKEQHQGQKTSQKFINYKNDSFSMEPYLCEECSMLLDYSITKLSLCPHEIKPRCRKCPNPCYDKKEWKSLAKIMRFSGLRLGLIQIRNKFFRL